MEISEYKRVTLRDVQNYHNTKIFTKYFWGKLRNGIVACALQIFSDVNKFPNMLVYIAYQHSEQQHYSCGRDAHENASSSKLWKSRVSVCDACCSHSSFRTFQHYTHDGIFGGSIKRKPVNALRLHFPKYYALGNIYDC